MARVRVTTVLADRCLRILQEQSAPIVAAELANRLGISGTRETQRRQVRTIIKHLRDECDARIVATRQGGYRLTKDDEIWRDYLDHRTIGAKRVLGETHRRKRQAARIGQGYLFSPNVA